MFTRPLLSANTDMSSRIRDPAALNYRLGDFGYGKHEVCVFQLKRDGPVHTVTEYKVKSNMRLRTHKEYFEADNSDIIGSDVQGTTIFLHAQEYGLRTPEEFALSLTQRMLDTYDMALESNIVVEDEYAWNRLEGKHNHAFSVNTSYGRRTCEVVRKKHELQPLLIAGISGLRVIKTAKSSFVGYGQSALRTEGESSDRIFSLDINAKWEYTHTKVDFSKHWYQVRDILLSRFAGDPIEGYNTPSTQYVSYHAGRAVLDAMPEIKSISVSLPCYDYYPFDFSRFPKLSTQAPVTICNPQRIPFKIGYAQVDRLQIENGLKCNSKI